MHSGRARHAEGSWPAAVGRRVPVAHTLYYPPSPLLPFTLALAVKVSIHRLVLVVQFSEAPVLMTSRTSESGMQKHASTVVSEIHAKFHPYQVSVQTELMIRTQVSLRAHNFQRHGNMHVMCMCLVAKEGH